MYAGYLPAEPKVGVGHNETTRLEDIYVAANEGLNSRGAGFAAADVGDKIVLHGDDHINAVKTGAAVGEVLHCTTQRRRTQRRRTQRRLDQCDAGFDAETAKSRATVRCMIECLERGERPWSGQPDDALTHDFQLFVEDAERVEQGCGPLQAACAIDDDPLLLLGRAASGDFGDAV